MTILSVPFAAFTLVVALALYRAPRRVQPWVWGIASLLFYALTDWSSMWVLVVLTALTYGLAHAIEDADGPVRSGYLTAGVLVVVGVLAACRYLDPVGGHGVAAAGLAGSATELTLRAGTPLGLSFYSLRLLAYLVDVHRGNVVAERHAGRFFAYVALFLEIGSGPIERAKSLLPQLNDGPTFDYTRVSSGLIRIVWGVLKKTVVADRLALPVAAVYGHPADYSGPVLLLATTAFAFQLYLDFSAYADMVLGAGQVLGLRLTENFNRPYFARSIAEFWNRWHISLSNWLRDYIFLPLAFIVDRRLAVSRLRPRSVELVGYSAAVIPTMLVAGWWHGLGWTYLVWGGLTGVFMAGGRVTAPARTRLWRAAGVPPAAPMRRFVSIVSTFAIVCVTWVFFRSSTLADAATILSGIVTWRPASDGSLWLHGGLASLGLGQRGSVICGTFLAIVFAVDLASELTKTEIVALLRRQPVVVRWGCYFAMLYSVFLFSSEGGQFIYFQF